MPINRLTGAVSLPVHTIHGDSELVDAYGDLLFVRSDDSVDLVAIQGVLNAYPEMIAILHDISDPMTFNKDVINRTRKLLSTLGET